ncbi:MAG: carbohydrate ABC transporter permease, partial [Proteobacteria bacterium]|nr:carbohydrate ABC transporter permease [Pseudomonadota bacterium]
MTEQLRSHRNRSYSNGLETLGAWLLALLWISPLLYAFWAAFHPSEYAVNFELFAPITLDNFGEALSQAPFLQYGVNTFMLVTMLLASQLVVCTLAAYAFARYQFAGHNIAFSLVLVQLMITPEILIVENYSTLSDLSLVDTITGIGLPYMASAFGIFLLRQA